MAHHNPEPKEITPDCGPGNVGFISKLFVQGLFPYRSTPDLVRQVRQGPELITIVATDGLPYGKYPRLILAYIITKAYQQSRQIGQGTMDFDSARKIPLGNSLNDFLRAIGVVDEQAGGLTIKRVREQVDRLASCSIIVENTVKTAISTRRSAHPPIGISSGHELWLSPHPEQLALNNSWITLTPEFFSLITERPIPVNWDVLTGLNKPRAMDIYMWLAIKKYWLLMQVRHDEWTIPWDELGTNFSPKELVGWQARADFRKEISKCVDDVLELWPDAGVKLHGEGLTIYPGSLAVPRKPRKEITD